MMHLALPSPPNPAPGPGQTDLTEQRARNFHGVETSHVFGRFRAFDIDAIGLCDHADSVGSLDPGVQ